MARDIDRKLRATSAALGLATRKDLAAAFRRVNAATTFDIDRAHKWLQGRSSPRDARLYQDWALVLDVAQSAEWIANCELNVFLNVVAQRYNVDREVLSRQVITPKVPNSSTTNEPRSGLAGTYVCYSNSWSPYFRGQIIRGALTIADAATLKVSYSEVLPTGQLHLSGALDSTSRAMHMSLGELSGDAHALFCLFPPTAPVRVLGGLMCGAAFIGPDSSPSVTRIIMIRLPDVREHLHSADAYLPREGSFAQDLALLGLPVSSPQIVDERLREFLCRSDGKGLDQPCVSAYRAIVEFFDREWLHRLGRNGQP